MGQQSQGTSLCQKDMACQNDFGARVRWMGDDSHFVLQFSSLFSVGMYICSVLQVLAWQEEYERVKQENVNLRAQLEAM